MRFFFGWILINRLSERLLLMHRVDKAIQITNDVICDNIKRFDINDRGLLSQNILSQVRNFVEYIAIKSVTNDKDVDPNDYELRVAALKELQRHGELRFLDKFHKMLQKSVSHYTVDKDGSERLMLKYYECLLRIKHYLKQIYNMNVLENIQDFPLDTDTELSDYYEKIAERVEVPSASSHSLKYNDRYYIQKIKPFFVKYKVYYEVTFTAAIESTSKFNRVIAFTQCEIMDNYAVKFSIHNDMIRILDKDMSILVIDNYEVSIRPCEWNNLAKIFGSQVKCNTGTSEYREMMTFLSTDRISLTELVAADQQYYDFIKNRVTRRSNSIKIYELLDSCRKVIISNKPGANVLRYLLHKMNNRIIKSQYCNKPCEKLSNLHLCYGCIPFDEMPYCTSLRQHNPRISDVLESISESGREHELFARYIKNNTEIEGHLFSSKDSIDGFDNIDNLIQEYNNSLYYKHIDYRQLKEFKGHIYINKYVKDCITIITRLQKLASSGISQYTASVDSWITQESYLIDDANKKEALRQMFANSYVALIYGSAGTGKSTLIRHVSNFWADKNKLFLANTHSAVNNMRRKVTAGSSQYSTIAKFLSKRNDKTSCDILFIDECSTVSNSNMQQVLEKANFKLLVLVGDTYQIESIYFGNWFSIVPRFLPKESIFELKHPYRTTNDNLLTIWNRVRKLDDAILEPLVKNDYVERLDESIFERDSDDEIILCLNYDGLYGINSINRFLQSNNPKEGITWGIGTYKVGDPILFNESSRFSPLIYNNSKGRIMAIHPDEYQICFDIELEKSINEINAMDYDFQLIGQSERGNSIISFSVNRHRSTDEDDDGDNSTVVPFQVAYAVSIHKAQGLEYDSVKIVITDEVEERITHNIFYTAITRAKNKLKIYWSPETEKTVLERFKAKDFSKDAHLLAQASGLLAS